MKIIVVGGTKNKFRELDEVREKYIVDVKHDCKNIDFLNPWYCELTGLYKLWMEDGDSNEIVGLEHYRRYFVSGETCDLLQKDEILKILENNDVICRKYNFGSNNPYSWWFKSLYPYGDKFIECIEDKNFREWYKNELKTSHEFCQCNMFICKRELMNKYCKCLFNTLIKMPKDFTKRKRIIGYLGEYFMGFWFKYYGYKIKYNKVAEYDKNLNRIIKRF